MFTCQFLGLKYISKHFIKFSYQIYYLNKFYLIFIFTLEIFVFDIKFTRDTYIFLLEIIS